MATERGEASEESVKKAASAPSIMGLNDNLKILGRQLHVQTENTGSPPNNIVTHVFCNGRVIYTSRSEYPQQLRMDPNFNKIQDLMRAQHLSVIKRITEKTSNVQSAS